MASAMAGAEPSEARYSRSASPTEGWTRLGNVIALSVSRNLLDRLRLGLAARFGKEVSQSAG